MFPNYVRYLKDLFHGRYPKLILDETFTLDGEGFTDLVEAKAEDFVSIIARTAADGALSVTTRVSTLETTLVVVTLNPDGFRLFFDGTHIQARKSVGNLGSVRFWIYRHND